MQAKKSRRNFAYDFAPAAHRIGDREAKIVEKQSAFFDRFNKTREIIVRKYEIGGTLCNVAAENKQKRLQAFSGVSTRWRRICTNRQPQFLQTNFQVTNAAFLLLSHMHRATRSRTLVRPSQFQCSLLQATPRRRRRRPSRRPFRRVVDTLRQ